MFAPQNFIPLHAQRILRRMSSPDIVFEDMRLRIGSNFWLKHSLSSGILIKRLSNLSSIPCLARNMDCGGNDETDGCRKRSNDETDGCKKRSVPKIDGCGYESDSSLLQSQQHVPSPQTLHNNFLEMPLFPEELKNRVLAETITHSFSSPRAKQLKSFMDHMNYLPREKRQRYIKEALSVYINEKKSDKTGFVAVGETKHSAEMQSRNRFVVAQESGENEIDDDGNPKKLQISKSSQTSKALDDLPQSSVDLLHESHINVADALDTIGPGISLKRTWVSVGNNTIPPGCYVREYRCYNKTCNARILVWASTNDLSSAPAYSVIHGVREHEAHQPIDWLGWYSYRCGKNPKSAEWDTAKYPKKPGLPRLIELAVIEVLRVNPNIGPFAALRHITLQLKHCDY